jgi:hypothetical protein
LLVVVVLVERLSAQLQVEQMDRIHNLLLYSFSSGGGGGARAFLVAGNGGSGGGSGGGGSYKERPR